MPPSPDRPPRPSRHPTPPGSAVAQVQRVQRTVHNRPHQAHTVIPAPSSTQPLQGRPWPRSSRSKEQMPTGHTRPAPSSPQSASLQVQPWPRYSGSKEQIPTGHTRLSPPKHGHGPGPASSRKTLPKGPHQAQQQEGLIHHPPKTGPPRPRARHTIPVGQQ